MPELIQQLHEQHDQFLETLLRTQDQQLLLQIAAEWQTSDSSWIRMQRQQYAAVALRYPGQEPLFRRLLFQALEQNDADLLMICSVELDRVVRRTAPRRRHRFVGLKARSNRLPLPGRPGFRTWQPGDRLFTQTTRQYFRRRVWGWWKRLSQRDPGEYVRRCCRMLQTYTDADFSTGEGLLDNRTLIHFCFHHSSVIDARGPHVVVTDGFCINDLEPAPWCPAAWETALAWQELLQLALAAESGLIRWWAATLCLQRPLPEDADVSEQSVLRMASRQEPAVLELAESLIRDRSSQLSASTWTSLLSTSHRQLLPAICDGFSHAVPGLSLSPVQLLELCLSHQQDVAKTGFRELQQCHQHNPLSAAQLASLARAESPLRADMVTWALQQAGPDGPPDLWAFLTAPHLDVRREALSWAAGPVGDLTAISNCCRRAPESLPAAVRRGLLQILHHHKDRVEFRPDMREFLLLCLQTEGCSRLRSWTVRQLIRLTAESHQGATWLITELATTLPQLSSAALHDLLPELAAARQQFPHLMAAMEEHLSDYVWNGSALSA